MELTTREHRAVFELVDGDSGDEQVERAFVKVLLQALRVFKERQRKYGRGNIARRGEVGVITRLEDKLARLARQLETAGSFPAGADESVEDTWVDVLNYGGIGLMCHQGTWPAPTPVPEAFTVEELRARGIYPTVVERRVGSFGDMPVDPTTTRPVKPGEVITFGGADES